MLAKDKHIVLTAAEAFVLIFGAKDFETVGSLCGVFILLWLGMAVVLPYVASGVFRMMQA